MISQMHHPLSRTAGVVLLVALVAFPLLANHFDQEFYVGMVSRLMIFALAATSLNLLLGFGGMVSMGHAAYLGAGAYTVGILMHHGVLSAWVSWPVAVLVGAVLAFLIGLVSLRTKGVYFIMITLAFAQMIYFIFVGLKEYGGEDGLSMPQRSATGVLDLATDINFYYVVLALTAISMYLVYRLVNSHFGRVLQAIKQNEVRMEAIGYSVVRYKLVCFVITGALASLAGALLANQNMMVSPSLVHWTQSGSLMVMVILGGTGFFFGGAIGAVVMLMLEEILSAYTIHWQIIVGAVLLGVVLLLPHGLASLFQRKRGDKA
ncbi:branched-chain amino acid ABC transporter permease [Massilia eurypsychrophila]|jgi:branched-chain amino acid transport system permease protein|uniref:Branched-chain amino acid ABC transporter permease n=1 Tax=Massilia eurypsychrophila TaxID=1485217 RepID=A0A2G8TI98_9BURK|nr:branched-chain amino acid ABC transporter permease [Massilia eurypsychrophila]PIL45777.1 branched-chain amino acid ABC transporter permease [Massilia eurypsychrophila]